MIPLQGSGWGKEAANDGNDSEREEKIRQEERSYIHLLTVNIYSAQSAYILKPQNNIKVG